MGEARRRKGSKIKVEKTLLFFSDHDQGQSYLIDTIWHEGHWWLVGSWLAPHDGGQRLPERLVRLTGLRYEEVKNQPFRFLLNNAIPKSVLDGAERATSMR